MADTSSLQRTYRYLRMSIAGAVVVIFTGVVIAAFRIGWLPSISAYYYTPARNVLVGALVAASLALLALSGRGVPRALLDAAALLAPLVAFVPTPLLPGDVPGLPGCPAPGCVPAQVQPDIEAAVLTYLVVVLGVLAVGVVLAIRRQVDPRAVAVSVAIGVVVAVTVLCGWLFARDAFLTTAHFAAASLFFLLIGSVAVANAFPGRAGLRPSPMFRRLYLLVAVGMVVDVAAAILVLVVNPPAAPIPWVLVLEALALALFLLFWVLQTVEKWNDPDPALAIG
ncbi:hypothetical protein [Naasia sp. SYSU D00057]|uniref:hypothetical protein n=1 Tax=Naasia sp. SYSU D00057 TaxID=2817380 RepID=UPI001B315E0C|nr:hypothetical protein [Naasia sp. SYSU D00057]